MQVSRRLNAPRNYPETVYVMSEESDDDLLLSMLNLLDNFADEHDTILFEVFFNNNSLSAVYNR